MTSLAQRPVAGSARARRSRGALTRELVVFGLVGAASTVVHLGGFVVLRHVLGSPQAANGIALLVAAVANTWANRRWTFGIRGRENVARHQLQGLLVLALTLAMTSGGLALLVRLAPAAPTWVETAVVALTTVAATAVKYLAMRRWVFAPRGRQGPGGNEWSGLNQSAVNAPCPSTNRTTT